MMGRTHVLLGISALWLLEPLRFIEPWSAGRLFPLQVIGAAVGALAPDLDTPAGLLSRASLGGVQPLALPSRWIHRRYGHRGALHSLRGWGVGITLCCPLILLGLEAGSGLALWLGLAVGYGSHLGGDALTRSGIPLFYPKPGRVHLLPKSLRLLTGSLAEDAVMGVLALTAMLLLLRHLPWGASPF